MPDEIKKENNVSVFVRKENNNIYNSSSLGSKTIIPFEFTIKADNLQFDLGIRTTYSFSS